MVDSENDNLEDENKKEKKTAKPKKITPKVRRAEIKILIPTTRIEKSVKCENTGQAYKIFRNILNYDTSVHTSVTSESAPVEKLALK